MLPIFIVNCNRLSYVQSTLHALSKIDQVDPIVLDNASTYPPLLEWYKVADVKIIRLANNLGPRALWNDGRHVPRTGDYFAVTDPDLDLSRIPADFIHVLRGGLDQYPTILKCGLSLEINDLAPEHPLTKAIRARENGYWSDRHDARFFRANIATTFALYRVARPVCNYGPALRSDRPYTARHLPWYVTPQTATDEDRYYWTHLAHCSTLNWSPRFAKMV